MALRRVFVDEIRGGAAVVNGDRAHHLARVVRLRVGESVEITDRQQLFLAKVKSAEGRRVEFEVIERLETPARSFPIVLQMSIFKFARLEWIIEKAAELGVQSIVPVWAAHSEPGLVRAAAKRHARWQKIAEEAAQQSRRLTAPEVEGPASFQEAVASAKGPLRLLLDSDSRPLKDLLAAATVGAAAVGPSNDPAYLLVGPEGGWTDTEREQARAAGYECASLGAGILRAETAALSALSILIHLLPQPSPR
jgi:16S rRNA (uracil1498-N3)-methyltransferase